MYYAAFDIGGTKTIVAVLDQNGIIIGSRLFASCVASSETHLNLCVEKFGEILTELHLTVNDMEGLGISLPGIVDTGRGVLIYAPYSRWENLPVAEFFRGKLGIRHIECENDVNACAVGELKLGLGKKYKDFVWMTVSTGVGGAVVSEGKLIRGADGYAGEFGHLKVEYDHPHVCSCGQKGCLEAEGSGTALNRMMAERAESDEKFRVLLDEKGLAANGGGCAALADEGNEAALRIFDRIGTYLGRGISNCINILNPQAVVLGGGVMRSFDRILPSVKRTLREDSFVRMQNVDIVPTALGYNAALLGAASLVMD